MSFQFFIVWFVEALAKPRLSSDWGRVYQTPSSLGFKSRHFHFSVNFVITVLWGTMVFFWESERYWVKPRKKSCSSQLRFYFSLFHPFFFLSLRFLSSFFFPFLLQMLSWSFLSLPSFFNLLLRSSHLNTSFCLRPLAKDQGITLVVVVLLLVVVLVVNHLVHFLLKINLSEKHFSLLGNRIGVLMLPSQALYQLSYINIVPNLLENYLFNLRISKTKPQTLDQSWPCYFSKISLLSFRLISILYFSFWRSSSSFFHPEKMNSNLLLKIPSLDRLKERTKVWKERKYSNP